MIHKLGEIMEDWLMANPKFYDTQNFVLEWEEWRVDWKARDRLKCNEQNKNEQESRWAYVAIVKQTDVTH